LVLEIIYYDVDNWYYIESIIVKILTGLDLDENAFLLNEIFIFRKEKKSFFKDGYPPFVRKLPSIFWKSLLILSLKENKTPAILLEKELLCKIKNRKWRVCLNLLDMKENTWSNDWKRKTKWRREEIWK
jgi:hypothetical protein